MMTKLRSVQPMVPTSHFSRQRRNGETFFTFWVSLFQLRFFVFLTFGMIRSFHPLFQFIFVKLQNVNTVAALVPTSLSDGITYVGLDNPGGDYCNSTTSCTPFLRWTDGTAFQVQAEWFDKEIYIDKGMPCIWHKVS